MGLASDYYDLEVVIPIYIYIYKHSKQSNPQFFMYLQKPFSGVPYAYRYLKPIPLYAN